VESRDVLHDQPAAPADIIQRLKPSSGSSRHSASSDLAAQQQRIDAVFGGTEAMDMHLVANHIRATLRSSIWLLTTSGMSTAKN
jgi:hypothetical protein